VERLALDVATALLPTPKDRPISLWPWSGSRSTRSAERAPRRAVSAETAASPNVVALLVRDRAFRWVDRAGVSDQVAERSRVLTERLIERSDHVRH
jgi:hypothetical protein